MNPRKFPYASSSQCTHFLHTHPRPTHLLVIADQFSLSKKFIFVGLYNIYSVSFQKQRKTDFFHSTQFFGDSSPFFCVSIVNSFYCKIVSLCKHNLFIPSPDDGCLGCFQLGVKEVKLLQISMQKSPCGGHTS